MLRYLTTIFLLTAFAAQTFQQGFTVLDYYINTTSFAKNCENKARPILHCNGKCQMMKKLKEEEKKDQQIPERKLDNKTEVVYFKSCYPSLFSFHSATSIFHLAANTGKEIKRPRSLLRPPIC